LKQHSNKLTTKIATSDDSIQAHVGKDRCKVEILPQQKLPSTKKSQPKDTQILSLMQHRESNVNWEKKAPLGQ
jgi:hypothetical protein